MKKGLIYILSFSAIISCKVKDIQNHSPTLTDNNPHLSATIKQVDEKDSICNKIKLNTQGDFLSLKNLGVSLTDEFDILPCWLSNITKGDTILETILINRLSDRVKAIKEGDINQLSVIRINGKIFSEIPSFEMLNIAFEFASIDTCIYYDGMGPIHFGYIGLQNLLTMVDSKYSKKYSDFYLLFIYQNKELRRYNTNSCEYYQLLYSKMYEFVKNDFDDNLITIKVKNQ